MSITENVKLFTEVAGNPDGAVKKPLGKIALFDVTVIASTALFVFKYVIVTGNESINDVEPICVGILFNEDVVTELISDTVSKSNTTFFPMNRRIVLQEHNNF